MKRIKDWYWYQMFTPNILGILINPFFIARYSLFKSLKPFFTKLNGKVLDIGCGTKPYEKYINCNNYIGLEYDSEISRQHSKADFYYDGKKTPFEGNSFSSVLCNQVLEHVFFPEEFLSEVHRVLKPGGLLLLTVPFVWDEHEQPQDFARYTSFGLKSILERNGFTVLDQKKSGEGALCAAQIVILSLIKLLPNNKYIYLLFSVLISFPVNLFAFTLSLVCMRKSSDLYLDNVVLAIKREA